MHELSIATSIVATVHEAAKKEHADKVLRVDVVVGKLSGIEPENLQFCWPLACKETPLEQATLNIEETAGRELTIKSMEID